MRNATDLMVDYSIIIEKQFTLVGYLFPGKRFFGEFEFRFVSVATQYLRQMSTDDLILRGAVPIRVGLIGKEDMGFIVDICNLHGNRVGDQSHLRFAIVR